MLDILAENGVANDTMVWVSSDNGTYALEKDTYHTLTMYRRFFFFFGAMIGNSEVEDVVVAASGCFCCRTCL